MAFDAQRVTASRPNKRPLSTIFPLSKPGPEPYALYEPPPALRATSPINGGGSASGQREMKRLTGNRCRCDRVMARATGRRLCATTDIPGSRMAMPRRSVSNAGGWTGHCSRHGLRILPHDVGEGDHAKHGGGGSRSATGGGCAEGWPDGVGSATSSSRRSDQSMAHKHDLPALASGPEPYALYEPPPALRATSPINGGGSASALVQMPRSNGNRCRRRGRWGISTSSCPCSTRASMPER